MCRLGSATSWRPFRPSPRPLTALPWPTPGWRPVATACTAHMLHTHYCVAPGQLLFHGSQICQYASAAACSYRMLPAPPAGSPCRPLPPLVAPVLLDALQRVQAQLQAGFPAAAACLRSGFGGGRNPAAGFGEPGAELGGGADLGGASSLGGVFSWATGASLGVQRPRLLVCGPEGTGQAHLGPAVLYALEGLPVHAIGLPSLLSDAGARAPEEALVHAVVEARRAAPAVLFLPHLQVRGPGCRCAICPTRLRALGWWHSSMLCTSVVLHFCRQVCPLLRPQCPLLLACFPWPAGVVGHGPQLAARHAVDAAGRPASRPAAAALCNRRRARVRCPQAHLVPPAGMPELICAYAVHSCLPLHPSCFAAILLFARRACSACTARIDAPFGSSPLAELDPAVRQLFNVQSGGAFELEAPTREQRSAFFRGIAEALALPPCPERSGEGKPPAPLPPLPRAPEAAAAEEEARRKAEEAAERQRCAALRWLPPMFLCSNRKLRSCHDSGLHVSPAPRGPPQKPAPTHTKA